MKKLISGIFATTITLCVLSAYAATTPDNADDASSIGTSESPQHKQQDMRTDKGPSEMNTDSVKDDGSNLGTSESPQHKQQSMRTNKGSTDNMKKTHTKKSKLMKTKEENGGTTKGNQIQPNQPDGAAPATN